jgi:tetratricopeptide (TPR) repeat protein
MGVAFYNAENIDKAVEYLSAARKQDPAYADPLFNLGKVEYSRNNKTVAKNYWQQYMQQDPDSNWVKLLRAKYQLGDGIDRPRGLITQHNEMLAGIQVGNYSDEVPNEWGQPNKTQFPFKDAQHSALSFDNGITTITEGEEIRVLLANTDYGGKTNYGVKIGDTQNAVIEAYGMPSMNLTTTQGNSLVYYDDGITFQLRNGKVVAWVIY